MGLYINPTRVDYEMIHRYDNSASRQCKALGVPYQYNGFLFDSVQRSVYDQVRNIDLYPVTYPSVSDKKLGNFLKVGDSIIQYYQQGYLRVEVSKITSHKNIYVQRWTEAPWSYTGAKLIELGYIKDRYDVKEWNSFKAHTSWHQTNNYWQYIEKLQELEKADLESRDKIVTYLEHQWFLNPSAGQITAPRTADREWRLYNHDLYGIPKERALYLKIQE